MSRSESCAFSNLLFVGFIFYNQQSGGNEESKGCNYFKWFNEDNGDERDATIGRQRRKIYALEKSVMVFEKRIKFLTGVICFLGFVNVILVCKLNKIFWFGVNWMQYSGCGCSIVGLKVCIYFILFYVIVMDFLWTYQTLNVVL